MIAYICGIARKISIVGPQGVPLLMAKHLLAKMLLTIAAIMITMKEIDLQPSEPYIPSPEEVVTVRLLVIFISFQCAYGSFHNTTSALIGKKIVNRR